MKYIDADKLKKEIEKLKTDFIKFHTGIDLELVKSYLGYRSYENVLSIIDSLQQEQQEEPDKSLEEAAEEYTNNPDTYVVWTEHYGDFATVDDIELIEKAFIAGAKWQKEQMGKQAREQLSKTDITLADLVAFDEGFSLGRRLERQDMMRDAVEGEIHKYDKFSYVKEKNSKSLTELLAKFNNSDKIKIIIVKEDNHE